MPSQDFAPFDPLAILSRLSEIDYLVIGGFAAVLQGAPTMTGDLDILPNAAQSNVARLADVLRDLGAVVREPRSSQRRIEVTVELLQQTVAAAPVGGQLRTLTTAGPLDILWRLHDGRTYGDLLAGSELLTDDNFSVRVLGLDDLIEIKSSIGRPRDHAALPYLRELRRRR